MVLSTSAEWIPNSPYIPESTAPVFPCAEDVSFILTVSGTNELIEGNTKRDPAQSESGPFSVSAALSTTLWSHAITFLSHLGTAPHLTHILHDGAAEDDNAYIAEVPELAGCMADGSTAKDDLHNVEQIIQEWIDTARELGREIPDPKGRLRYA